LTPQVSARPSPAPSAVQTPAPPAPSPSPTPVEADVLAHGSARDAGLRIRMAPGPDGTLFVSIPRDGGSLLAVLDATGVPRPGWPIVVKDTSWCNNVLPVADGSVRVVCSLDDESSTFDRFAAFAFDANAGQLAGWPVDTTAYEATGRVIGTDLMLYTARSLGEDAEDPSVEAGVDRVAANGSVERGTRVGDPAGSGWWIGPDGVAYGVAGGDPVSIEVVDSAGEQAPLPVSVRGVPSVPASGPGGRVVLTVGNPERSTTRVVALDPDGGAVRERSAAIPIVTVDGSWADTGGCSPYPQQPLVADDGTIFVYNEADSAVVAVDPSLKVKRGWPYELRTSLVMRDERYVKEDAYCPYVATPAVAPDGTLYLPLHARAASVGGSLVAVGPDGRVRAGWPVELKRPGSEFWSVVVGADGTAFVLAIEPESARTSSASILAIAPDSTVRYSTTIMDP
jgi:hypothetical protein